MWSMIRRERRRKQLRANVQVTVLVQLQVLGMDLGALAGNRVFDSVNALVDGVDYYWDGGPFQRGESLGRRAGDDMRQ